MSENFNSNTNQNPTNNTTDLASYIDANNAVDPSCYHTPEALQNAPVAPSDELEQQTHQPRFAPIKRFNYTPASFHDTYPNQVVEGALLEGKLTKAELLNDRNGFPFLKITVALNEPVGWNLSHCHFFNRQKATSTEAVLEMAAQYLAKFNYQLGSNDYANTMCLIQVGEWISDDGRKHLNAKKLFRDAADYDSYYAWLQRKQQQPPVTREPMELPAI